MRYHVHRIRLLDAPEFTLDDKLSGLLKSPKGIAVVSYLIIAGRPQEREKVADLLGDVESLTQSLKNLRSLLSRIRRFVPELAVTRRTLAFAPTDTTEIDLYQLRTGLSAESPLDAANAFKLYRGDLLDGFYLSGAPRFNEWLTIERERLRQQVISISHGISQQLFDRQAWQVGIELAQQRVQLDDLDEEAHQWLMRFFAASGQLAAAKQQYRYCRQLLWEELGIEPSPATQQIARQLEEIAPSDQALSIGNRQPLTWDGDALPDSAPLPPGSMLPYRRNRDFIGRKQALFTLARALLNESPHPAGAIVTGLGGLGKTQLAVEFAFRFGRFFPGGVYWMSFAEPDGVADEVAAIGAARGMQLYESASRLSLVDRVDRVRRAWLEPARRLLIFDNCEDAQLLAHWLPVSGGCSVLVTARKHDWPRELGLTSVPLTTLARDDSVALLRKLAPRVGQRDGREIATELGDLPLALHLAGGFLHRYTQVSAQTYLAQLRDRDLLRHPSLSGQGTVLSPTGHDLHIGRTFAINFAQLNPDSETDAIALRLLTIAACFAPGEPIAQTDLIRATIDQRDDWMAELLARDGIGRLAALGFIDSQGGESVVMHRLVAAFVRAEVAEQHVQAVDRVADYLADQLSATQNATIYLGNLPLAAAHVRHVVEHGLMLRRASAARLSSWYVLHRIDAGTYAGLQQFVDEAIALLRQHQPAEVLTLARSLNVGGTLLFKQSRDEAAWPYYAESYELCRRELGDGHVRTINALQNLAILRWRTGKLAESLAMFEQALRQHEALQPPQEQLMIRVLQNMGSVLNLLGRFADAQHCQERVLRVRQRTLPPDHPQLGETYNSLGAIAYRRGDYQTAVAHHNQSLQIRLAAFGAENYLVSFPHLNLGMALVAAGDVAAALAHLDEAARIRRLSLTDDSPLVARVLSIIGRAYLLGGELNAAEAYLLQALAIQADQQPERLPTAESWLDLAAIRLAQGRVDEARELLGHARTVYEASLGWDSPNMAPLLNALGELALHTGDKSAAIGYFEQARAVLADKVLPTHVEWVRALGHLQRLSDSAEPNTPI